MKDDSWNMMVDGNATIILRRGDDKATTILEST